MKNWLAKEIKICVGFLYCPCVDKYLKVKRGKSYWCFVDSEKKILILLY
jgi:hypothetical protein